LTLHEAQRERPKTPKKSKKLKDVIKQENTPVAADSKVFRITENFLFRAPIPR
jgi:hypothetical protein